MNHIERAVELNKSGYNCAQSIFCAFSDITGISESDSLRIAAGLGGGVRAGEVCGAVSGMAMAAGMKYGAYEIGDNARKKEHYALIQELARRFKEKNGTIICRELLHLDKGIYEATPEVRSTEYYKKRPCREMVEDAAYIFAQYVQEQETAEA